uniref:Uncharacterized protein n=1 Tax=Rhizophora mucronata TaxID=61149 RepID=A0A2P2PNP8_RHIMU
MKGAIIFCKMEENNDMSHSRFSWLSISSL